MLAIDADWKALETQRQDYQDYRVNLGQHVSATKYDLQSIVPICIYTMFLHACWIMQPLSILCRSLRDIDTYTTGFPRGTNQGQANIFRAVKRAIPGPVRISCYSPCIVVMITSRVTWLFASSGLLQYTFILPASKEFPKQCIKHGSSTRYAKRRQVGVRIPDDPICQAILQNLDEPLICTRFVVHLNSSLTFAFCSYLLPIRM